MNESTRLQQALNDVTAIRQPVGRASLPPGSKRRLLVAGGLTLIALIVAFIIPKPSGTGPILSRFLPSIERPPASVIACIERVHGGFMAQTFANSPKMWKHAYPPCWSGSGQ